MNRPGGGPSPSSGRRQTVADFLRQCLSEFRKMVWPDGRALANNATVMLLALVVVVAALASLELGVGRLMSGLFP